MKVPESHELQALRAENALLKDILDNIHEGIFCINQKGEIILYNRISELNEGLKKEDVLGKQEVEVYGYSDWTTQIAGKIMKSGIPLIEVPYRYVLPNGQNSNIIFSAYPFFYRGEQIAIYSVGRELNYINSFNASTLEIQRKMLNNDCNRQKKEGANYTFGDIIGDSDITQKTIAMGHKLALRDSSVLITGETGTGKELFAHSIHNASPRAGGPFIPVNCAAIPATLMESVLFGTVKGAFTGAVNLSGLFEQAGDGTIFLDEVNSIPLDLQPKLLRVLQDKAICRIGSNKTIPVNCRIISACNEDPLKAVQKNRIRSDLYFRLAPVLLPIVPLRERPDDLLSLCSFFLKRYNQKFSLFVEKLDNEVLLLFRCYEWPGNVRELENTIEGILVLAEENLKTIKVQDLPPVFLQKTKHLQRIAGDQYSHLPFKKKLCNYEKWLIENALKKNGGNVSSTAEELGMSRQNLHVKIRTLDIIASDD